MSLSLEHSAAVARAEDPAGLESARSGSIVAPLSQFGLLRFQGQDAETFLQGQLTCDVSALGESATYGGYCSPQGRLLASFLAWREGSGFVMMLSNDIAQSTMQRLKRFVLRARVVIGDVTGETAVFGIAGPEAAGVLRTMASLPGDGPLRVSGSQAMFALRQDGSRFLVMMPRAEADRFIGSVSGKLKPAGEAAWQWLDIRGGIPWITAATQDQFVPQMINLEQLGGVSFAKGCYTGQEVVARAQHLGKVKRRMFVANVAAVALAGDALYAEDRGAQAVGSVVNAAPSPDGGSDVLAVVHTESRERSIVHLKTPDGPRLSFLPSPDRSA